MEGWSDFYVAAVGGSAALAGLLVVAISINIAQIMKFPLLPGRAAQTIIKIGAALVWDRRVARPVAARRASVQSSGIARIRSITWRSAGPGRGNRASGRREVRRPFQKCRLTRRRHRPLIQGRDGAPW